jgi:hypothetical protein
MPSAVVYGSVTGDGGMPISGARLSIPVWDEDVSGDSGEYSLASLQDSTYTVSIKAPYGSGVETWYIYVDGLLVKRGSAVDVGLSVGRQLRVDFFTEKQ